jgi:photosystem II stability/assembly factor-like uncharacterized protein
MAPARRQSIIGCLCCCACVMPLGNAAAQTADVRFGEPGAFAVIEHDAAPGLFAADPLPRTTEVLQDAGLNDVCAAGAQIWAVGDRGQICRSDDSGQTWSVTALPFDCCLTTVVFLTGQRGWVAGWRYGDAAASHGHRALLLETRDGGSTWSEIRSSAASASASEPGAISLAELPGIRQLHSFGLLEHIVVTQADAAIGSHTLFRSTDGGQSWVPIVSDQPDVYWSAAAFMNPDEGIAAGADQVLGTVVSGEAVVLQSPRRSLRSIRSVSLGSDGAGWAGGDGSLLLQTMDGGITWGPPAARLPAEATELLDIHAIAHRGEAVVIAGNPGSCVIQSRDGGRSWQVVPVPGGGLIRSVAATQQGFVAVGSFGRILTASASSMNWQCVRNSELHAAVLVLNSDADAAADRLLAAVAADDGYRSVVHQPVVTMAASQTSDRELRLLQHAAALNRLTCNEYSSDWMLPLQEQLSETTRDGVLADWMRRTDGQAGRILPLRLARSICSVRPLIVVIERPAAGNAVTQLLAEAIVPALKLAEEAVHPALAGCGLRPWRVQHVVQREEALQRSSAAFEDMQFLSSLGTTIGLACQEAEQERGARRSGQNAERFAVSSYRSLETGTEQQPLVNLLHGLALQSRKDVRRTVTAIPAELRQQAAEVLNRQRAELIALSGAEMLAASAEAFVGHLQETAVTLPPALALLQLTELAALCRARDNAEGLVAANREIIRRFPKSAAAKSAAAELADFYGSAELRHVRIRRNAGTPAQLQPVVPGGAGVVQPRMESAAATAFAGPRAAQAEVLAQAWDEQYDRAWEVLTEGLSTGAQVTRRFPAQLLARAAMQRRRGELGACLNLLASLSARSDHFGRLAQAEMNIMQGLPQEFLPVIQIPAVPVPPVLDARLVESVWVNAAELRLQSGDSAAASVSSFCMLAWDREHLYLSAVLERTSESGQIRQVQSRTWDEDHESRDRVTFLFDTDRDYRNGFELTVDESGRTSDRCGLLRRWNPEWFVAVESETASWRLEVALPLSELSPQPIRPGDEWILGVTRVLPGTGRQQIAAAGDGAATNGCAVLRFAPLPKPAAAGSR